MATSFGGVFIATSLLQISSKNILELARSNARTSFRTVSEALSVVWLDSPALR